VKLMIESYAFCYYVIFIIGRFYLFSVICSYRVLELMYASSAFQVLLQNDSPATLLARVMGIIGSIEQAMLAQGRDTYKYFTKNHMLYERNQVCALQCLFSRF